MNVLFLTLLDFHTIAEHNIYTDLLREFMNQGHQVYTISPVERRTKQKTHVVEEKGSIILKLKIGNIQKTNVLEKGITTVTIESSYIKAIKKWFGTVRFDLVLYSTPPITFGRAVAYVKRRDKARTYLLLKDIFPQNAVDMGMLSKTGVKGELYRYFRAKEKKLYEISDTIGCMSKANVEYVLAHNPEIRPSKVEIYPNCVEPVDMSLTKEEREKIRKRYHIPNDKMVFVYGGNLGKPQGIDFLIECLCSQKENDRALFLIVGNGTEYQKIEESIVKNQLQNVRLMKRLPKEEYDLLIAACDVGMIFLDHRFTIPNFPSRLLGYMQARLPVLACTDPNTDIGEVIVNGGFGWWCESDRIDKFLSLLNIILYDENLIEMGEKGFIYLKENCNVLKVCNKIIERLNFEQE